MSTPTSTIQLKDLQDATETMPSSTIHIIAGCMDNVLSRNGVKNGELVYMPSLMSLARFFQASHITVHDAFQQLRRNGYDYHLTGMDNPIQFWYTPVCDEAS